MSLTVAFESRSTLFTMNRPEAATEKGKTRASTTAADGTLITPVKIEDSDGDGDTMSDAVLTHFNEIADEMVPSPSDQLSPTFLQRAPPRRRGGNLTMAAWSSQTIPMKRRART